ncbi:LacI family DNA-binding transcriptional regulator [Agromyces subbeticus]|uniref:LacI family DNA-binding transcriptional regulator n=1 Tax=Agromyces subbeticus TaxID=293890 RepID=UPI0003B4A4C8|nr:LacI family DNA-binding transcriptional regulator [Agromyces subbeticus]
MPVTQFDVASIAGVSRKTVSNVINGYPHISPDVITRVNAAIAELGYTPSRAARSLRTGRTRTIQLIIPELDVSYFAELARWVVTAAEERQLAVIITQTLGDPERERRAIEGELAEYADGSILSPVSSDLSTISQRRADSPIVLVGELAGGGSLTHIGIDNVAAAELATRHLIDLGRQRIAFIGAQPDPSSRMAQMRLAGYRNAIESAGHPFEPGLIAHTVGYHRADGADAMHRLFDSGLAPDAVFCATDLLAMGAMRAARDIGLEVPSDLAVVGFDDIEEGRYSVPTLTTISPDKRQIAELAVTRLEAAIDDDSASNGSELPVSFSLIRRESTEEK